MCNGAPSSLKPSTANDFSLVYNFLQKYFFLASCINYVKETWEIIHVHSLSRNQRRKSNSTGASCDASSVSSTVQGKVKNPACGQTRCAFKVTKNKDGTIFTSSQMNMRETGRNSLPQHRTEGGKWWENWKRIIHIRTGCAQYRTSYCICTAKSTIIKHWCQVKKHKTTQMKDSTHTVLDNLSDRRGHAVWQKDWFCFFFFLFLLATWKDILHLAHIRWIRCILKQNLRA